MNPLLNNRNTIPNNNVMQNIQNIKNMMNMFNMSQNPQQAIQQLAMQNPQINQIMEMAKSTGGNLEQLFKNMCQQQGVDPNTIINQLR